MAANSWRWLTGLDVQRAPLQAGVFAEGQFGGAHSRDDGPRLREKRLAGLGQLDAAADSIEELRVMARLQRRDRMARRGLREVQRLGGSSDVLAFSDRDEDAELLKGHFDFLYDSIGGMDPSGQPSGGKSAAPQLIHQYDYTKQNLLLELLVTTGYFPFQPTAADARHGWNYEE